MLIPYTNAVNAAIGGDAPHTLYFHPFSLYSIIVRFAIEIGQSLSPNDSPNVKLRLLNLQNDENLTEEYLTLSPKGQVPVLRSAQNGAPDLVLEESKDILTWLCGMQPDLIPDDHRQAIESLLESFYSFHAKPLTVKSDERSAGIANKAAAMLERTDISESYRRCLEIKSVSHDTIHAGSLDPDNVDRVEAAAKSFFDGVSDTIRQRTGDGPWIFGTTPTVLDAAAAALVVRLMEVNQTHLLNDMLKDYATGIKDTEEWRRTLIGRPTIYDNSLGAVADMKLFV